MINVIKKISYGEYGYAGVGPFAEITVDSIYEAKILLGDSHFGEYRLEINYSDVDKLIEALLEEMTYWGD